MQEALFVSLAQCLKARLCFTVLHILRNAKRGIEEYLFGLGLAYTMLVRALSRVPFIPIEAGDPYEGNHDCIL